MAIKKKNRSYDREFIEQTINLTKTSEKPVSDIAKDLGIPASTLHAWIRKYRNGEWTDKKNSQDVRTVPEQKKITDLEKKLKSVEMERDILKKAMVYFVAPQK